MSALRLRQETPVRDISGSPDGVRSGSGKKRRNLYRSEGVVFDTWAVGVNRKWPPYEADSGTGSRGTQVPQKSGT